MIHAYDEQYLDDAMRNLGEAFDFVRNICQVDLDDFLSMMIATGIAGLFECPFVSVHVRSGQPTGNRKPITGNQITRDS